MGNWKTATMVKRYAHRADQHIRDAEERLAEALHIVSHSVSESDERAV
jgi:hypothetical protein